MVECNKCNNKYEKLWYYNNDDKCTQGKGCDASVYQNEVQGYGDLDCAPSFKTIPRHGHYIQCHYGSDFDMCIFKFNDENVAKPMHGFEICDNCIEALWKNGDIVQVNPIISLTTYDENWREPFPDEAINDESEDSE